MQRGLAGEDEVGETGEERGVVGRFGGGLRCDREDGDFI